MLKILQAHLLRAFVANLKIDAIYALYPESFCDKDLAIRKVFAFCDSVRDISSTQNHMYLQLQFEGQKNATNCSARQRAISLGRTLHNAHQVHAPCTSLEKEPRGKMLASSKAKLWNFSVCGKI